MGNQMVQRESDGEDAGIRRGAKTIFDWSFSCSEQYSQREATLEGTFSPYRSSFEKGLNRSLSPSPARAELGTAVRLSAMWLRLFALNAALRLMSLLLAGLQIVKPFHYLSYVVIFPVLQSLDQVDDFSVCLVLLCLLH